MSLTYENNRSVGREFQQEFGGINRRLRPSEYELADAKNLSVREYPVLTSRKERTYLVDIGEVSSPSLCIIDSETVAYFAVADESTFLYINGERKIAFEDNIERSVVKLGAYLCIFPDGLIYNINDQTYSSIIASASNSMGPITFSPCGIDGELAFVGEAAPLHSASTGDIWYNTAENKSYLCSGHKHEWFSNVPELITDDSDLTVDENRNDYAILIEGYSKGVVIGETAKVYAKGNSEYIDLDYEAPIVDELSDDLGPLVVLRGNQAGAITYLYEHKWNLPIWVPYATSYTKIEGAAVGNNFRAGDVVEITGCGYTRVYAAVPSTDDEVGYIVVGSIPYIGTYTSEQKMIKISRNLPDGITNVIECANRLWATDSKGHEIYASKLGDPFNWYAFSGLASDSYAITVGQGGEFTGAIAYDGYPHFFKEDRILKVYGNYPFTLYTIECPGVASNAKKSLASYSGAIIYKAPQGFFLYDGSYPSCISENINDICGLDRTVTASAGCPKAYYAAVTDSNGASLYVYEKGAWHIQDSNSVLDMKYTGRDVLAVFAPTDGTVTFLSSLEGNAYPWANGGTRLPLPSPEWFFETPLLGLSLPQDKYFSHFIFTYSAENRIDVKVTYDGVKTELFSLPAKTLVGAESVQMIPSRCGTMKLRMEGTGDFALYSFARNIEGGNNP